MDGTFHGAHSRHRRVARARFPTLDIQSFGVEPRSICYKPQVPDELLPAWESVSAGCSTACVRCLSARASEIAATMAIVTRATCCGTIRPHFVV